MDRDRSREDWAAWMPGRGASGSAPRGDGRAPIAVPSDDEPASTTAGETVLGAGVTVPGAGRGGSARREATRRCVLDAAGEVFAERGVIGATVEDICERAGFTRGAFYSNFTDKDDLLGALVEQERVRLLAHLDAILARMDPGVAAAPGIPDIPDPAAAIPSVVDLILRSVPGDRRLSLLRMELELHAVRDPELARPIIEANLQLRARIATLIGDAMARHGLELVMDAGDAADAVLAVVERSARQTMLEGRDADPDSMARRLLPGLLLPVTRRRPA